MEDKFFYSTDVEWTGARHGNLTAQSLPALVVDAPPEFNGREGTWTPGHLFIVDGLWQ
jgi:organic hydroperoxide reductase OsmC/OhrA